MYGKVQMQSEKGGDIKNVGGGCERRIEE